MAARAITASGPRLAAVLAGLATLLLAGAAGAAEYWQLRRAGATIVVEGDRKFAERALARVLLVQATARLLVGWPAEFQPRPVLAFVVDEHEVNRIFASDPPTTSEHTLLTPGLTVVVAPLVPTNRRELEHFQQAYGAALLTEAPTEHWPECARLGFRMIFTVAEYTGGTHLYVGAEHVVPFEPLTPEQFLGDPAAPVTMLDRDRRGYSCYLLDLMLVSGDAGRRAAIAQLYASLGAGAPLETAIAAPLGGTLPGFVSMFRDAVPRNEFAVRQYDVKADLTLPEPLLADAERITAERLEALLKTLCAKLAACRAADAAAAH